jgi:NADPH:quinone reductase-like Zn-dependent oxidoreductase
VTSGSDEKIEKAKELGAEGGVNYNSEEWSRELKSMTGGVDLSVDHVGGEAFDAMVSLARPGSRIVTFGATAGPKVSVVMPRIFLKHLTVLGTAMGTNEEFGAAVAPSCRRRTGPTRSWSRRRLLDGEGSFGTPPRGRGWKLGRRWSRRRRSIGRWRSWAGS